MAFRDVWVFHGICVRGANSCWRSLPKFTSRNSVRWARLVGSKLFVDQYLGTSESIHKVVPPKFKQIGVFRVDLAVIGITDPSPSVDGFLEAVSMFSTRDRLPFVKSYRGFRKDPKCGQQRTHHCRSSGHFRDLIEVTECLLTTELTLIFVVYPG